MIKNEDIQEYVDKGYVSKRKHPTLPLFIYCYTQKTEIENNWNEITRKCRGLILDDKDRIIFNCPEKFFNVDQNDYAKELLKNMHSNLCPKGYKAYDKLDGSAIWIVNDKEYGLIVASKSSFESDQAKMAKKIIEEKDYKFEQGLCYCFELVSPNNQIVIKYDFEDLVLWAIRFQDWNDKELPIENETCKVAKEISLDKVYDYTHSKNVEGVVLVGEVNGKVERLKLKSEEYLYLHKIATGATKLNVWRILNEGKTLEDYVKEHDFPDEWLENLRQYEKELTDDYKKIEDEINHWYETLIEYQNMSLKGIFLNTSLQLPKYVKSGIAMKYKKKDGKIREMIYKMIRPKGD